MQERTKRVLLGLGLFMALAVSFGTWAASSPAGSSPDDPFHLASIWCASDLPGRECAHAGGTADEGTSNRLLPRDLVGAPCYAMDSGKSASCQRRLGSELVSSPVNDGLYPTGYYRAMHLFVGHNVAHAVLRMRLVNGVIGAGMMTAAILLAPAGLRRASALSWLVGLVPLGMFFVPSTNPTAWVIIGLGTYWVFLVRFLTDDGIGRILLAGAMAAIAALMTISARVDGAAYLCVATAASVLLAARSPRDLMSRRIVLPVVIAVGAFVRFVTFQTADVLVSGASPHDASEPGRHGLALLLNNLFNFPTYFAGMFGQSFGLGWLDTFMPPAVGATTFALAAALVLLSPGSYWHAKRLAVLLLAAAVVAVPVLVLQQSHAFVGEVVQPRYVYPLVLVFYGAVVYAKDEAGSPRFVVTRAQVVIFVVGASLANAVALHTEIKRYVTGLDVRGLNLDAGREWWWSAGPGPLSMWLIGCLAGGAAFSVLALIAQLPETAKPAARPLGLGEADRVVVKA